MIIAMHVWENHMILNIETDKQIMRSVMFPFLESISESQDTLIHILGADNGSCVPLLSLLMAKNIYYSYGYISL